MKLEPIRSILNNVNYTHSGDGYSFKCPAHDDKHNSAYVKSDEDGNAILKCFAGCSRKAICEALGIRERDLYIKQSSSRTNFNNRIIATYPYYDVNNKLLYERLRLLNDDGSKTFLYRRSDGTGSFLWTLSNGWFEKKGRSWKKIEGAKNPEVKPKDGAQWFDASPRSLYQLSALRKASTGSLILYCEGEKDVENAERLGFVATTAGSASDWRTEFADFLQGLDLVIIPDNDVAGLRCAERVAKDCLGKVSRLRVLELPDLAKGGDLSDWIQAGGTHEDLLELIENAPVFNSGTALAIGGQNVHLSDSPEIDISELQEVADEDPVISEDPKREWELRQYAWNMGKGISACSTILRQLGFEKNHARLLNALISVGGARLSVLTAYQAAIRARYADSGKAVSEKTVRRDLRKFLDEQAALGVVLLSYQPGGKDFATGKPYPCKFQNHFLRYGLQAINLALDTREDFGTARLALEAACRTVVADIPRMEPIETTSTQNKKPLTVEDLEARLGALQEKLVEIMVADGWTAEEIEAEIELQHRRFYDQLKKVSTGRKTEASITPAEEVISF